MQLLQHHTSFQRPNPRKCDLLLRKGGMICHVGVGSRAGAPHMQPDPDLVISLSSKS